MKTATATVIRLPSSRPVKLDDGPATIALVQREIFRCGWTYQRIATASDLSITTVHHIASGDTRRPALRTIMKILMALGWEVYASERRH